MHTFKRYIFIASTMIGAAIGSAVASGTLESANGVWHG